MIRSSPEFLELQEALAGRFSIEREIGRGGMGVVFLARDVRLERQVAIKLLAPALAVRPDMRRRFLREARIAAQCFHPHIVPIHAVEEHGNLAWFVMSYVRGETLAQRVARTGAQSPALVERIAREMGWALAYAHERGVVHRDIKPENILLEQGTDRSLLSDFGIAFIDDPTRTPPTGEVAGTASYMAPEQALGETVDARADIYALGVTLFVAATGRHPFSGASSMAMIVQHATAQAPSTHSLAPALPTPIADAIDKCMAKRVDDRFPTAMEFLRSLEQVHVHPALPREALAVESSARATETLIGWSGVTALSTVLFMLGETSGFGRDLMGAIGGSVATLLAAAATLRLGETVLAARHALKSAASPDDVVRAISGRAAADAPRRDNESDGRKRIANAVAASLGVFLAVAQGPISSSDVDLPDAIASLLQVAMTVVPPFLIGRGLHAALANSPLSAFARRHIGAPIGRAVVRMFGATPAQDADRDAQLAAAPTEVVLDHAAQQLFTALPAPVRDGLTGLPHAIESLSRDAERLRRADRDLIDAERAARAAGRDAADPDMMAIAKQRDVVRGRLATTIAALEAIRLDLMRLAAGAVDASSLTAHLQVARDLEYRLAADADVRELLAPRFTAGAST